MNGCTALLGLALALGLSPLRAAAAEPYPLGSQDQVRVKVYEWRASHDTIFEWTALNDVFTVGADGFLALPFAGRIPAEGQDTDAVAGVIAQNLVRNMGLGQAPDVAVEVVAFRPFYIVGDVMQPGEFPFRPGLSVLQATGIAGGLRRAGADRMEREIIAGRGDVSQLSLTRTSLLARLARLRAEAADADEVVFPPELAPGAADAAGAIMAEQERALFLARREGQGAQLRALDDLRSFLERETDSLDRQVGFLDQQITSVEEELASVKTLVEQGLAVAPRQLALERSLLQVQGDRLAAETALLRAKQEASRTELSTIELRSSRASEVAVALRDTEMQLSEIQSRTQTALDLLQDSETSAPSLAAPRAEPTYTIVRPTSAGGGAGEGVIELTAGEATAVRPGDTIKVELPLAGPEPEPLAQPAAAAPALALHSDAGTAASAVP